MENGIYKSKDATYFVKDGKIVARIMGGHYKTTENFMLGAERTGALPAEMEEKFDEAYEKLKSW